MQAFGRASGERAAELSALMAKAKIFSTYTRLHDPVLGEQTLIQALELSLFPTSTCRAWQRTAVRRVRPQSNRWRGGFGCVGRASRASRGMNPFYDTAWNLLDLHYREDAARPVVAKPANLDQMMSIASRLSADFDFVRVDLYSVNERIYFGELTFTPTAGFSGAATLTITTNDLGNTGPGGAQQGEALGLLGPGPLSATARQRVQGSVSSRSSHSVLTGDVRAFDFFPGHRRDQGAASRIA